MIKTLKKIFKLDKEKFKVPKSVQDIIPAKAIWEDGIFLVGKNKYKSKIEIEYEIEEQVLFSGLMGLRVSEVNGIKYTDVDFVNRKLKVQRQLGVVANSNKEDYAIRTYTKQEIPVKSFSSNRELDIPDIVFDAILA